jgi:hypothetical protein
MSIKFIKLSLIIIGYVISFGFVCPFLISYKDDFFVFGGIAVIILTLATLPTAINYVLNLVKGK